MVSTRSGTRKKEMATSSVETHPNMDATNQGHPRRCSETAPLPFPSLNSPLWTPVGKVEQARPSSSILRTPRRVLNEPLAKNTGLKIQESQHKTSSSVANLEDHPSPNVSTGSHYSNHPPYTLDDLDMQLISQLQEARQAPQCTSLNITELARRHQGDGEDDPEEVQSYLDPSSVFVNGHKVKKEYGPLLAAIFVKYGDIAIESEGKPASVVSFFLERTCAIFERLKAMKFKQATEKDLEEMLDEVRFLEGQEMNVGWLREKLQYVCETKRSFREYLTVKEEGKRLEGKVAMRRNELRLIEEKLRVETAEADRVKKRAREIKARVGDLWAQCLVDGLL